MTTLNQLLAIEKGVSQRAQRQLTDAYHLLQRPQLFNGQQRTYQPKDDEGERLPAEPQRVQQTVAGVLVQLRDPMSRWLDVQQEKDVSNLEARADVVAGEVTIRQAPVTYLLWLEKRLQDFKTVLEKLPLLDPSDQWQYDDTNGIYANAGVQTLRTAKERTAITLAPATDKHPAQVDVYNRDVTVGTWTTIRLSGAVEPSKRLEALERVDTLLAAVKSARELANMQDVTPVEAIGQKVFDYIFAPIT